MTTRFDPQVTAERDADCLRNASRILWNRARKRTFMLRVICRVLTRTAERIDGRRL